MHGEDYLGGRYNHMKLAGFMAGFMMVMKTLISGQEFHLILYIVAFGLWVFGIVYCDRIAFARGYNVWLARVIGIFIPYIGPLYYWYRKSHRRHRRRRRHSYRPQGSWTTTYGNQRK